MAALRAEEPTLSLEIVTERVRAIFVNAVVEQVTDFLPDAKAWHDLLMISHKRTDLTDYKTMFKNSFTHWMDNLQPGTDSDKYQAIWTDRVQDQRKTWGGRTHNFCKVIGHVF